jgi:hypothetical protein
MQKKRIKSLLPTRAINIMHAYRYFFWITTVAFMQTFFPLEHSCKLGPSFRILQDETNSVMHICSEEETVSTFLLIYRRTNGGDSPPERFE